MSVVGGISEVKGIEDRKALVELLEFKLVDVDAATSVPVGISEAKGVEYRDWIDKLSRFVISLVNWTQNIHLEFSKVLDVEEKDLIFKIKIKASNGRRMMTFETKVLVSTLNPVVPATPA
ncbi:hypothetical protein Hanom_Chr03g00274731 [Helianthus anomalus]